MQSFPNKFGELNPLTTTPLFFLPPFPAHPLVAASTAPTSWKA